MKEEERKKQIRKFFNSILDKCLEKDGQESGWIQFADWIDEVAINIDTFKVSIEKIEQILRMKKIERI